MRILNNRLVRSLALLSLLALIGFNIWTRRAASQVSNAQARVIPPEGVIDNDTGGKVPGNPANAEEDFMKIYAAIQSYNGQHGSKYPTMAQLMKFTVDHQMYRTREEAEEAVKKANAIFINPDNKYSDVPSTRKNPSSASDYNIYTQRPDGTPVGNPPSGKKDVLAMTGLYVHQNIRQFKGERSRSNPVGFYVVLWQDGTIQKIGYDKILYVPKGGGDFTTAFPGQAGVPANALTYDEFYRVAGWKKGPRGEEGGRGQSYNDKPVR